MSRTLLGSIVVFGLSALASAGAAPAQQFDLLKRLREKAEELKRTVDCAANDEACVDQARKEGRVVKTTPAQPGASVPAGAAAAKASGGAATAPPPTAEFTSTPLAPMPAVATTLETVVSDDGAHAAGMVMKGSRVAMVIDGKEGPLFDQITPSGYVGKAALQRGAAAFGPDGKRVAYVGVRAGASIAVVDGQEGPPFARIVTNSAPTGTPDSGRTFYFSDDGSSVAYIGLTGEPGVAFGQSAQVVLDGQPGPKYVSVPRMIFAGRRLVYLAMKQDRKVAVVVGGKEIGVYDSVNHLIGNKDGHYAYVGMTGNNWTVALDGQTVRGHQRPTEEHDPLNFALAPAGKRLAYVTIASQRNGDRVDLHVDGKVVRTAAGFHHVIFSPDGRRLMASYSETKPSRMMTQRVMVDDWTSLDYQSVRTKGVGSREEPDISFSPDSKHFAFVAGNAQTTFVVIDGQESSGYGGIQNVRFSATGRLAFEASDPARGWFVVVDGREGPKMYTLGDGSLTFSADGSRVAYAGTMAPGAIQTTAVIDGQPQKIALGAFAPRTPKMPPLWQYRMNQTFVFSPDGKRLAMIDSSAGSVRGTGGLVLDGTPHAAGHLFSMPTFSADGRRFACAVWLNQKWQLLIDGKVAAIEGDLYEVPRALAFEDDGSVRFLLVKGNWLYRVVAPSGGARSSPGTGGPPMTPTSAAAGSAPSSQDATPTAPQRTNQLAAEAEPKFEASAAAAAPSAGVPDKSQAVATLSETTDAVPRRPAVALSSSVSPPDTDLAALAAVYAAGTVDFTVALRADGVLTSAAPGQAVVELVPAGDLRFTFKGAPGFSAEFRRDANGVVNDVLVHQPNGSAVAVRVSGERLDPKVLSSLAGEYEIGSAVLTVRVEGGGLTYLVPGQPLYHLVYAHGLRFSVQGVAGVSIEFQPGAGGEVTGLVSRQANGDFPARRRR